MAYHINLGGWQSIFAVPSCVVDNYIKTATESQLKVLLYLLRNSDRAVVNEQIEADTGVPADEIDDVILFWENRGIITNNKGELSPSDKAHTTITEPVKTNTDSAAARVALKSETLFPPREIASAINGDKAVKHLFEVFEKLAGRPTKHSERNTLMILIEEVKLPCEVAVMLVQHCFSIDKASPAYMKAVAMDWYESGIDTLGKAEERIKQLHDKAALESRLRTKFGLTTAFSAKQKQYIEEWNRLNINDALLDAAYDATLNGAGKLSFPYMDKILKKWHEDGITDPSQLEKYKKKTVSLSNEGSSFDISEFEQTAYERYRKK